MLVLLIIKKNLFFAPLLEKVVFCTTFSKRGLESILTPRQLFLRNEI